MLDRLITRLTAPIATVFAVPAEMHDAIQTALADNLANLERAIALAALVSDAS